MGRFTVKSTKKNTPVTTEKKEPFVYTGPKRETKGPALLDCQANPSCGQWVHHVFSGTRKHEAKIPYFDHIYTCKICGAEKKWGNSGEEMVVNEVN